MPTGFVVIGTKQPDGWESLNLKIMDSLLNSIGECCGAQMEAPKQCESPSLITTLKRRQLELKEKLSTINDALAALEQHPDVAKVIELVARSRW